MPRARPCSPISLEARCGNGLPIPAFAAEHERPDQSRHEGVAGADGVGHGGLDRRNGDAMLAAREQRAAAAAGDRGHGDSPSR